MSDVAANTSALPEPSVRRRASWLNRYTALALAVIFLIGLPVSAEMVSRYIYAPFISDYDAHLDLAMAQYNLARPITPHFLYHTLLTASGSLFNRPPAETDVVLWGVVSSLASAIIVLWLFNRVLGPVHSYRTALVLALLAVATLLLWEINIFSMIWERTGKPWVVGYIRFNSYHNPTLLLLRPLALLLSVATLRIFRQSETSWTSLLLIGALAVLSCLAKPNYAMALIPGVFLVVAYRLARRQGHRVNWFLLIGGLLIPVGLMLLWQYLFTYNTGLRPGIELRLSGIYIGWGLLDWLLPVRYGLTVLFPLAVALLYFRQARRSVYLAVSWASFAAAVLQANLLMESGPTALDGNFTWGLNITVYIVFIASLLFFLKENQLFQRPIRSLIRDWRFVVSGLLFCAHLANGIVFFVLGRV